MVKFLIKLIAAALAKRIERGSARGAITGAALGASIGALLAWLVLRAGWLGAGLDVALYVSIPIVTALSGAVAGAAISPRSPTPQTPGPLRLGRYNKAAGSLAVALTLILACVFAVRELPSNDPNLDPTAQTMTRAIAALIAALTLCAVFVAWREIWYVDLGPEITLRWLTTRKVYARSDLTSWGFEVRPGNLIQRPFTGTLPCRLQFSDGRVCRVELRGEDSAAVVTLLSAA